MPRSADEARPWLLSKYLQLRPSRVVDVGPGAGTYADYFRPHHSGYWIGIEAWAPYMDAYRLPEKYDEVVIADARTTYLPPADLYICGDVLEHMERDEAVGLIGRVTAVADHLMVSVPIIHYEQGAVGGNPHEAHHYHWTHQEMTDVLGAKESFLGAIVGAWCINLNDTRRLDHGYND